MTKKTNRIRAAHIITGVCILAALALVGLIFTNNYWDFDFMSNGYGGTKLEFTSNSGQANGFNREATLYANESITSVSFSGKITVDGTAEISVISNDDGNILFSETYTNVKSKGIAIEVNDLAADTFYTLRFSSSNAKKGYLLLTTYESLVERLPDIPRPPKHPKN